ncbi:uncharacterized protein LOC144456565 [Phascolarctos cinereus]
MAIQVKRGKAKCASAPRFLWPGLHTTPHLQWHALGAQSAGLAGSSNCLFTCSSSCASSTRSIRRSRAPSQRRTKNAAEVEGGRKAIRGASPAPSASLHRSPAPPHIPPVSLPTLTPGHARQGLGPGRPSPRTAAGNIAIPAYFGKGVRGKRLFRSPTWPWRRQLAPNGLCSGSKTSAQPTTSAARAPRDVGTTTTTPTAATASGGLRGGGGGGEGGLPRTRPARLLTADRGAEHAHEIREPRGTGRAVTPEINKSPKRPPLFPRPNIPSSASREQPQLPVSNNARVSGKSSGKTKVNWQ